MKTEKAIKYRLNKLYKKGITSILPATGNIDLNCALFDGYESALKWVMSDARM
jgi:hypothetical protein